MSVRLQLTLQESVIAPSSEWMPRCEGWILIRVADGAGYWLRQGAAGELNIGDGLALGFDHTTQLRASLLCPMRLHFVTVYPQYLSALLTMREWYQSKPMSGSSQSCFLLFRANESTGRAFSQLVEQSHGSELLARCALLKFWADIAVKVLPSPDKPLAGGHRLRKRFRQMFARASATELSNHSLPDLAQQMNCSIRRFRSLFREEFGMPFHLHQTELRLWHARQLLAESDNPIMDVANQCGYRHMSLFGRLFKIRFGMTPGEWRRRAQKNGLPPG